MFCPECARPVESTHRFCGGCGRSLVDLADRTGEVDVVADDDDVFDAPDTGTSNGPVPLPDPEPPAEQVPASIVVPSFTDQSPGDVPVGDAVTAESTGLGEMADLPDIGDLPTRQIEIRPELPEPQWARTDTIQVEDDVVSDEPIGVDDAFGSSGGVRVIQSDPTPPALGSPMHTGTMPVIAPVPPVGSGTEEMPAVDVPPLFDGATDVRELPLVREPFKLKLVFLLAFFGGIAVLMASAATMIDLRTTIPVDGISTGPRVLDDLGTNLAIGGFVGVAVMVIGGLLSCIGFRWGGGLAGGAGLAVTGWAAVTLGLAELPIADAESTTRASPIPFTLKVTRDLGFWLVLAAGAIGVLVFLASLRSIRSGGHPPHNPWVAAIGAVSGVVLVAGPLLPEGDATFSDNFTSANVGFDLPMIYLAGRHIQLGLILLCVVVGLLIVRAYGLGLAAGGVSVAAWMWLSSLIEFDTQPPGPMGLAIGNFGAADLAPHAVTTVGVVLTLAMLLIAAVLAGAGNYRHHHRRT